MTRDYRANGKRAVWDWKPAMDRELLSVTIQPHTERYRGSPSCFSEVAEKYGRTIKACSTRYYKLRKRQGEIGQWTDVGLWTPEEDNLILAQIPLYGRVADGTWVSVAGNPHESNARGNLHPRLQLEAATLGKTGRWGIIIWT